MDFVSDHLVSGRRFRILTVVDQFSRRCPGVLVDTSIPGGAVARFLDELAATSGYPEMITVDNGPEFISNALDQWVSERGVKLVFTRLRAGRANVVATTSRERPRVRSCCETAAPVRAGSRQSRLNVLGARERQVTRMG